MFFEKEKCRGSRKKRILRWRCCSITFRGMLSTSKLPLPKITTCSINYTYYERTGYPAMFISGTSMFISIFWQSRMLFETWSFRIAENWSLKTFLSATTSLKRFLLCLKFFAVAVKTTNQLRFWPLRKILLPQLLIKKIRRVLLKQPNFETSRPYSSSPRGQK